MIIRDIHSPASVVHFFCVSRNGLAYTSRPLTLWRALRPDPDSNFPGLAAGLHKFRATCLADGQGALLPPL